MKLKKAAALLMGIVLILSPVSSVQASDVSSESQIVVTSEVSNESESESLDSDENESMETQSEVAETSIESTVQSEMDNETETSANDVENEMFQQISEMSGNMTGSYIECELDQNTPIYHAYGRSGGRIANESEVPYNWAMSTVTNGLDSQYAYNFDQAHLENTYLINIKKNASDVKRQIIEHGAAGIISVMVD